MAYPKHEALQVEESSQTSIFDKLREDHRKVKELFKKFEETEDESTKQQIADIALKELTIHAAIEEEIFYPAVREKIDDKEIMNEADEEHYVAKFLISELENMEASEERFSAKFTVLAENVKHHIQEEESQMFPKAEKMDLDAEGLGHEMEELKEAYREERTEEVAQERQQDVKKRPAQRKKIDNLRRRK